MTDVGYVTKEMSLPAYKKMKIKMLAKEFGFNLTNEERNHINSLESETAIDQYCRTLYRKYL